MLTWRPKRLLTFTMATGCTITLALAAHAGKQHLGGNALPGTSKTPPVIERAAPAANEVTNVAPAGTYEPGDTEVSIVCAGTPENEPDCGLPVDTTNGGCNSDPPVFGSITCDETICGTAAFDGVLRDTDWYAFTVPPGGGVYTLTVTTEFLGLIGFINTNDCATASSLVPLAQPGPGQTVSVSRCFAEGTWWAFVAPEFAQVETCGVAYSVTLTCDGPCPVGACCFFDGSCTQEIQPDCEAAGGEYQGDGVTCDVANCVPICGPGAGPCDAPNGTRGCEDVDCCELICSMDPFCCDVEWDDICADEAITYCGVCSADFCDLADPVCPGETYFGNTFNATSDYLDHGGTTDDVFFCGVNFGVYDVWCKYIPEEDGMLFVHVEGPNNVGTEWVFGVYDSCPNGPDDLLACNVFVHHGVVVCPVEEGQCYWIRAAARGFARGEFVLDIVGPDCAEVP
jgi:hypothetical protein